MERYKTIETKALADYIEVLQTDAFKWLAEREFKAYGSMVTIRFALADKKLRELFTDVRRESVGIEKGPSLEGMSPSQAIKSLMGTYNKSFLIKQILSKQYGKISIIQGGKLNDEYYGRPRHDLVTTQTILHDLRNMAINVTDFARMLEETSINETVKRDIAHQDNEIRRLEEAKERQQAKIKRQEREKEDEYQRKYQRKYQDEYRRRYQDRSTTPELKTQGLVR